MCSVKLTVLSEILKNQGISNQFRHVALLSEEGEEIEGYHVLVRRFTGKITEEGFVESRILFRST